jgi:hypothetical protein
MKTRRFYPSSPRITSARSRAAKIQFKPRKRPSAGRLPDVAIVSKTARFGAPVADRSTGHEEGENPSL